MSILGSLYGHSLALLTDLYQLTMAYGYWKAGVAERRAAFHLFFRRNPFAGGYSVACGLATAAELLRELSFDPDDIDYLRSLRGNDGAPLFEDGFLDYLAAMKFSCDIDAMPEGTVAFPHEPMLRVVGPVLQCQLIETPLLNIVNFQTLIATKAARVCYATRGEPVLEFGLRRAQGIDGSLAASRAAYIGGCAGTSNVLAGKLYGIPVKGTHAHSWVMFFDDESEAFRQYADAMPNNCVFLVDTYDTVAGVEKAIEVGKALRERGHEMVGVRLDSGDLAHLSIQARQLLDDAGFPDAAIVASNDLDEQVISSLKEQGATIAVWGVGTKLVTAYDQPALGGVYKLAAVEDDGGWRHKIKLSEQPIKISNPGIQQVRRYLSAGGEIQADLIYDLDRGPGDQLAMVDLQDGSWRHRLPPVEQYEDLLVPVFRAGEPVGELPGIEAARARTAAQLAALNPRMKRFVNPQLFKVGLEPGLAALKQELIDAARGEES
jgi:nicotinate phosphoribosyltransferase